jgi:hypothetical protein
MILRFSSRLLGGSTPHYRIYLTSAPTRKRLLPTNTRAYASKNAPKSKPIQSVLDEDVIDTPRQTYSAGGGGGGQGFAPGGMNLRDAALTTIVGLGLGESCRYVSPFESCPLWLCLGKALFCIWTYASA